MDLIEQGLKVGIIKFDDARKNVTYVFQNKRCRFSDPEEQVRLLTYLDLIFNYKYKQEQVLIEINVPHRVPKIFADIVVYKDNTRKDPFIVVECKSSEITDAEYIQAIEQGFGYTNSIGAHYLIVTSGLKTQYYNVLGFPKGEREENLIADIPKFGSDKELKYKYVKGGIGGYELKLVTENELVKRFEQAHDTLWGGGQRNPSEAFDELDKIIFCKLWDENVTRKNGEPYDFQIFTGEHPEMLMSRIRTLYNEGRKRDSDVFSDSIGVSPHELQTIVGYLAPINLSKTDLDSKGKAFETFLGSFFRGEFGQFFTPRTIVKFIVDSLPIDHKSLVLDPACGSGGFLLYALDKIRNDANQMAKEGYFEKNSKEHFQFWHDFAENNLYGIEINKNISRTAKMNMIIHDDGHTNVINNDALEDIDKIHLRAINSNSIGYKNFKENNFNYIITNPPFGAEIKRSEKRYFENYELGKKDFDWIWAMLEGKAIEIGKDRQNSEILFIEQCYNFLKVDGIMAMVVPDGILTNSSLQYVRNWIEDKFRIVSVVSLPQTAFTSTGAGVKSSVIFLKKYSLQITAAIKETKQKIQTRLFGKNEYGAEIRKLITEKDIILKHGDNKIKEIENNLVNHIKALEEQGTLTSKDKRILINESKEKIKLHKKTLSYIEWEVNIKEEYSDKIDVVFESLNEEYIKEVNNNVTNYSIMMAIAGDIGYDATGRKTVKNDLNDISEVLSRFMSDIETGQEHFFQLALS